MIFEIAAGVTIGGIVLCAIAFGLLWLAHPEHETERGILALIVLILLIYVAFSLR